jgi:hypothetical protein
MKKKEIVHSFKVIYYFAVLSDETDSLDTAVSCDLIVIAVKEKS